MLDQTRSNIQIFKTPFRWHAQSPACPKTSQRAFASICFFFLYCFVFTIPWENVIVLPGIGTISHLVGYLAFGLGLLGVIDNGRLQPGSTSQSIIFLFAIWRTLSYFWTAVPEFTLNEIITTWQIVGMIWLVRQLAPTQTLQTRIMQAYVLGALVSALDTIWQYVSGAATAAYLRYTASGFDPNELGLMMVLSLPLSLYFGVLGQKRPIVWLYRFHLVATIAAIFLTASRGAFISSFAALLFIPATFRRWSDRQKSIFIVVAMACVWLAMWLVPASSWKRLGTIQGEVTQGTLNERSTIWKGGVEIFREHPILGVGAGSFSIVVRHVIGITYVAHNTFLSILAEQGLIGFGIFMALLITSVVCCLRMPELERKLWLVMLLTLSIGILGLTWEYRKPMWLIFALISMQETVFTAQKRHKRGTLSRVPVPAFLHRPTSVTQ